MGEKPGPLEHGKMLGDRRKRHVERCGQFRDRGLAAGQALHDRAPGRIGERRKDGVQVLGQTLNHLVYYSRGRPAAQAPKAERGAAAE